VKKLEREIYLKLLVPILGSLSLFVFILYTLFHEFTLDFLLHKELSSTELMHQFYLVCMELGFLTFFLFLFIFYSVHKFKKSLLSDLDALSTYVEEISQKKNYKAIISIQHYIEFLYISIQLKNIIKRVYKKDKK